MKAKTMLGMIACASACVSLSTFANENATWFGARGNGTNIDLTTATTNGVAVSVAGGVITLDNDLETALTVEPETKTPARSDKLVTITTSNAVLTASAATDLPTSEISEAQVGFAVAYDGAATNYYYYANGEWNKSGVTADPTASVTFTITLDYRSTNATFRVGETTVAEDVTFTGNSLNHVAAFGNGSLTSINAEYEIAVAAYGDNKYGSIADAVVAAKNDGKAATDVQAVDASGDKQNKDATASNGLNLVVCEAMGLPTGSTGDDAEIKLEKATKSNANKITLAWRKPESGTDNGVTIQFQIKKDGVLQPGFFAWDEIQIPMETGIYTVVPSIQ